MLQSSLEPRLPLLIIVEGENDVSFLTSISAMLHRANNNLPDLARLTAERRVIFLPTGGNNLNEWVSRVASLRQHAFFLFDREQEPETTIRKRIVETINQRLGCRAVLTQKRAVENYLHPLAILEVSGIDFCFDDNTDVASLLALRMLARSSVPSSWHEMPSKRQRRLHDKAKKLLNEKAVQRMTPALLAQQDPHGEIVGWLRTIGQMFAPVHERSVV